VLPLQLCAALLPDFVMHEESASILVLRLVEPENLRDIHLRLGRFVTALAARLGTSLGQMHRHFLEFHRLPLGWRTFCPLPFFLMRPVLGFVSDCSAANLQMLKIVQQNHQLCAALDALAAHWRRRLGISSCLIHADLRLDNCCAAIRPARLHIVDWELASEGDPAWDAGTVLADYLSAWLMSVPLPAGADPCDCLPLATVPHDSLKRAARAFWFAYAGARRLDDEERAAELDATMRYAATRLLQLAYEHLQSEPMLTMHALCHLQVCDNLFAHSADGAAQLLGIPS
jgi:hypothetical protein